MLYKTMLVYLTNIRAKFHSNPIRNDGGAIDFFEERRSNKNKNKMSSDMGSVPDPKVSIFVFVFLQQIKISLLLLWQRLHVVV